MHMLRGNMDIGTHCSLSSCKRLDFLPFSCDYCQGIFCKEHQVPDAHACTGLTSEHRLSPPSSLTSSAHPLSYPCSLKDCRRRDKVEVRCPYCHEAFCLHHRHQQDHNCAALVAKQQQLAVRKMERSKVGAGDKSSREEKCASGTDSKVPKVIRGARSKSTQAKVAIMKLKLKAEGLDSIPQAERIYFDVQLPKESGIPNKPMYFSKEWSVGKIVDVISHKHHLRNDNNRQHSQKLLLHSSDGESFELSQPLSSYLERSPSGSLVILEYSDVSLG